MARAQCEPRSEGLRCFKSWLGRRGFIGLLCIITGFIQGHSKASPAFITEGSLQPGARSLPNPGPCPATKTARHQALSSLGMAFPSGGSQVLEKGSRGL